MPTWLRHYTFQEIKEYYEKEKEEMEKAKGGQALTSSRPSPPPSVQKALQDKAYRVPAPKPK